MFKEFYLCSSMLSLNKLHTVLNLLNRKCGFESHEIFHVEFYNNCVCFTYNKRKFESYGFNELYFLDFLKELLKC